jgi:hypothetical protein
MMEITLVMDFGGLAHNEGTKTGIPDLQHSPEFRFTFHLCCFRFTVHLQKMEARCL